LDGLGGAKVSDLPASTRFAPESCLEQGTALASLLVV
jgi:hypothetical protein